MSIGISEEHVELARSLREWAASLGGRELVRAAEAEADATFADAWKACVEMGVATIGLPESHGGGGGTVLDQAVALEACAHELVPGPLLGTAVASLVAPCDVLADGVAVAIAFGPGLVGDLAGATHVLGADGSLAPIVSSSPVLGVDLSRRFGSAETETEPEAEPETEAEAEVERETGPGSSTAVAGGGASWSGVRRSRWRPPRRPVSRGGAWRRRWTTRRSASSSARRSVPSRRSSTCAPRCSRPPRP